MDKTSPRIESESDQYLTPRWWHKPFWTIAAGFGILLVTFYLFVRARLIPADLMGIAIVLLASIPVGLVIWKLPEADQLLSDQHWFTRSAVILVVLLIGIGAVVAMYRTAGFWLPHFR